MGAHNDSEQIYQAKAGLLNLIPDPGNGGTIHFTKDDAICLLTINTAGQTRAFDSASSLPLGVRITVVADQITNSGTCTLEGVTFLAEGDEATYEVVRYNGAKAWSSKSSSPSMTVSATNLSFNSINQVRFSFGSVTALVFDDSAITGEVAAASTAGKSARFRTQDGGASAADVDGVKGGDVFWVAGNGADGGTHSANNPDGGDGGSFHFTTGIGGAAGDGGSGAAGAEGVFWINGQLSVSQVAPTAKTTAVTLTAAELRTGIITATHTTGSTAAYTLPAPVDMVAGLPAAFGINASFDWSLINLSAAAADTVTVTANGLHTVVGYPVVASSHATTIASSSARFRTRRVAASTWVTYRIA